MGGDGGCETMVRGVAEAAARWPHLGFELVGDAAALEAELARHPILRERAQIAHASGIVSGADNPAQALRRALTTSMGLAVDAVRQGHCAAAVSAGNTGALMAIARRSLGTLPGISRPALAAMLPSLGTSDHIMLDLGANKQCDARNLVQFAIMGAAYARAALGLERPSVALLNIGTEDLKGTDAIRDAATRLRGAQHLPLDFKGFIEGDQISRGVVDVVVCDGFSGNIALKTIEGTARFVTDLLRRAFTSSLRSKFGFLISKPATELMRHHLDPNNHNGAVFLGLGGVVVKSHGSASPRGIANAIGVAAAL
ncbi:MAG: phosphate acyltransferase PlsX, partial [Alphaproteobacteria bacterium]|nr:phosphate acyltransferase PlsX [Alphaproteobacteria bacterium]